MQYFSVKTRLVQVEQHRKIAVLLGKLEGLTITKHSCAVICRGVSGRDYDQCQLPFAITPFCTHEIWFASRIIKNFHSYNVPTDFHPQTAATCICEAWPNKKD